ncbi:MAG TPA: hypothetical protein VMD79_16245 [Solirubrobacteraceae bacterium]|nr:hypothetical protein [Solirubrobacteraceae bacterium]
MPLWVWVLFLAALVKIPLAGLMLWVPYHNDQVLNAAEAQQQQEDSSEEDGGSKALPGGPLDPHPRAPRPRRPHPRSPRRGGPHGSPSPSSPPRVRTARRTRPARPLRISH